MDELEAAAERVLVDFLRTDLSLCFTFADLIKTELSLGDEEAARLVVEKAEAGYANITRFLPKVENVDERQEIALRLAELRARLDDEWRRLKDNLGAGVHFP